LSRHREYCRQLGLVLNCRKFLVVLRFGGNSFGSIPALRSID
jgi:hypothetical protein